eukprot:GHVN01051507.1.p1 GENE.GHVN01051507.1~~GHVN01051507.1.p1  ORF type:complete len:577 (-),score=125.46 GHVN01051507.1:2674-4404(-)
MSDEDDLYLYEDPSDDESEGDTTERNEVEGLIHQAEEQLGGPNRSSQAAYEEALSLYKKAVSTSETCVTKLTQSGGRIDNVNKLKYQAMEKCVDLCARLHLNDDGLSFFKMMIQSVDSIQSNEALQRVNSAQESLTKEVYQGDCVEVCQLTLKELDKAKLPAPSIRFTTMLKLAKHHIKQIEVEHQACLLELAGKGTGSSTGTGTQNPALKRLESARTSGREVVSGLYKLCDCDPDGTVLVQGGSSQKLVQVYSTDIMLTSAATGRTGSQRLHYIAQRAHPVLNTTIVDPFTSAVIKEGLALSHLSVHEWDEANKLFFEAFMGYQETSYLVPENRERARRCLKYLVISGMLSNSTINPFDSQEAKVFLGGQDDGEIAMFHDLRLIAEQDNIPELCKFTALPTTRADRVLAPLLDDILLKVRCRVLKRSVQPYACVRLSHLAKKLYLSHGNEVAPLLAKLILDGEVDGYIDQHAGFLHICNSQGKRDLLELAKQGDSPLSSNTPHSSQLPEFEAPPKLDDLSHLTHTVTQGWKRSTVRQMRGYGVLDCCGVAEVDTLSELERLWFGCGLEYFRNVGN